MSLGQYELCTNPSEGVCIGPLRWEGGGGLVRVKA